LRYFQENIKVDQWGSSNGDPQGEHLRQCRQQVGSKEMDTGGAAKEFSPGENSGEGGREESFEGGRSLSRRDDRPGRRTER